MPTELIKGLTTDMTFTIIGSVSEFGPEGGSRQLTPTKIKPKYEARAIYEMFKGVGTRIYAVASDVQRVGEDEVYPNIAALPERVDVLIMSLGKQRALGAINEAAAAGISRIWFQPATFSEETRKLCEASGIEAIEGCALRHRTVSGLTRFISPCFYMGRRSTKLPVK